MLQRHDLLHISVQAAQRIFSRWRTSRVAWQQAFAAGELPGIVRRPVEENHRAILHWVLVFLNA